MVSIMACSSARVSGFSRSGMALPRMAIVTRSVRRARAEAVTMGDGIMP